MRLEVTCQVCRTRYDVMVAVSPQHAELIALCFQFCELGPRILRYLALWQPSPERELHYGQLRAILIGLNEAIKLGRVTFKNREVPAPLVVWQQAFDTLFEQVDAGNGPEPPLTSHNYLKAIIVSVAHDAILQLKESRKRQPSHSSAAPVAIANAFVLPTLSPEEIAARNARAASMSAAYKQELFDLMKELNDESAT